jgi:hypothetical protein
MLKITAPERVYSDQSYALPIKCEGNCTPGGVCVLTAVRLETGFVTSAPALFTAQTNSLDVRHDLNIPWRDGTLLVTLLRGNQLSNRVRIRIEKSRLAFRDPEVEKFIARHRRRGRPLPIRPEPGIAVAGSAVALPWYRRLPESPEVPAQPGIALTVRGTVVRASFRLPVLDIDIISSADRSQTSRFGYLQPTAVVPITLMVLGNESSNPLQLDIQVPSYSEIDLPAKDRAVNGFFALDLADMKPDQGSFVYAFAGEILAGPVRISP